MCPARLARALRIYQVARVRAEKGATHLRETLSEAEMAKLERMLADAKSTPGGGGRGRRFGVGGGADATGEGGKEGGNEGGNEGGGGGGGAVAKGVLLDRKLKELEAELSRAFPPTHPAFPIIFPERLICREYESTLAEARVARRRAAAKQTSGAKQTLRRGRAPERQVRRPMADRCERVFVAARASASSSDATTAARVAASAATRAQEHGESRTKARR